MGFPPNDLVSFEGSIGDSASAGGSRMGMRMLLRGFTGHRPVMLP